MKKIKDFFSTFFRENYKTIIFFIIFFLIVNYPVPYYVFTSGGITDLSERFEIDNSYNQKGSYNLSYVNQVDGNVLTYILANIIPDWDLVKVENYQYNENESLDEMLTRDKLSLANANQLAVIFAYSKAGKEVDIKDSSKYIYAVYPFLKSDKKIKIGDIILKIDDVEISNTAEIVNIVQSKEVGDHITALFDRNGNTYSTDILIQEENGKKMIGLQFINIYDFDVNPDIVFKFKDQENGGSAGLMTTLAIYDSLIEEDLTNGLKIAGTGTIEEDGSVGPIGGVKYKLAGAVRGKADIFFAPAGENYEEAIEIKKKRGYDINIVEVNTLDDAINYLKSLKNN